jgi:hypothetical protein
MREENVQRVLDLIRPTDLVLDIGGWARPFNRANFVIDMGPFETRGFGGGIGPPQGGKREFFTKATWIQRDICRPEPYPFANRQIDFVICSQTLEDVRDPLWVCSEMVRVAKRGYLEVPSRLVESCRGVEPNIVGWSHHRWLIDIEGNHVQFMMKYHMIHSHWRFSLPSSFLRSLPPRRHDQWLFWQDSFDYSERIIHGLGNIASELERFVLQTGAYSGIRWEADRRLRKLTGLVSRVMSKLCPLARRA